MQRAALVVVEFLKRSSLKKKNLAGTGPAGRQRSLVSTAGWHSLSSSSVCQTRPSHTPEHEKALAKPGGKRVIASFQRFLSRIMPDVKGFR